MGCTYLFHPSHLFRQTPPQAKHLPRLVHTTIISTFLNISSIQHSYNRNFIFYHTSTHPHYFYPQHHPLPLISELPINTSNASFPSIPLPPLPSNPSTQSSPTTLLLPSHNVLQFNPTTSFNPPHRPIPAQVSRCTYPDRIRSRASSIRPQCSGNAGGRPR